MTTVEEPQRVKSALLIRSTGSNKAGSTCDPTKKKWIAGITGFNHTLLLK
jgi:hypothetical protein